MESWVTSAVDLLESDGLKGIDISSETDFSARLMRQLVGADLEALKGAEELISTLKTRIRDFEDRGDDGDADEDGPHFAKRLDAELKSLKAQLKPLQDHVKRLNASTRVVGSIKAAETAGEDTSEMRARAAALDVQIMPLNESLATIEETLKPYKVDKAALSKANREARELKQGLADRLRAALLETSDEAAVAIVSDLLLGQAVDQLVERFARRVVRVTSRVEELWFRYQTGLRAIEQTERSARDELGDLLGKMGYAA